MEKTSFETSTFVLPAFDPPPRADFALAVRFSAVEVASRQSWRRIVRERVAPHYKRYEPLDEGKSDERMLVVLLDRLIEEFVAISEIWSQSHFVTDAELALTKPRKPLTRHGLSRRMHQLAAETGEAGDMSGFESRANRLVEAMLTFQLLEEQWDRANFKPLKATVLLNHIMLAHNAGFALLINQALNGEPRMKSAQRGEG